MIDQVPPRTSRLLADLGFRVTFDAGGRTTIADLVPAEQRCAIYVLHFADGQYYVGQSVEVSARFQAHRRSFTDIAYLSFKPVPREQLDHEERTAVGRFERAGLLLRNVDLVSWPIGPSRFDVIMSPEDQERWLADPFWIDQRGPRGADPSLRHRTANKLIQLRTRPLCDAAIEVTGTYVRATIPAVWRSEMQFWSLSCLPAPSVYVRVNIHQQEVFHLVPDGDDLACSLYLTRLPRLAQLRLQASGLLRGRGLVEIADGGYVPGGQNQMSLFIRGAARAVELLRDEAVLAAAREFNLGLMRKGPSLNRESHCIDLADCIL